MKRLEKIVHALSLRLSQIGEAALALIMLLIVANIILRLIWSPIKGTYEIVEILAALMLSLGAAYCAVSRSHIAVDFLVEKISRTKQFIVDIFTNLISFLFISFISWGVLKYAGSIYQRGRETTALGIPLYPVCYMVFFGIVLLALVVLVELIRLIVVWITEGGKQE